MESKELRHKIKKYTYKLKNSKSDEFSEYYQKKLEYYHQINQYGGLVSDFNGYKKTMSDSDTLTNELMEKYKDIITSSSNPKM